MGVRESLSRAGRRAQRRRRGAVGRSWERGDRCSGAVVGDSGGGRGAAVSSPAPQPLPRCCRHGAVRGRGTPARTAAPRYCGAVPGGTGPCPSTGRVPRCSAPAQGPPGRALWDRDWCQWGTMLPPAPAPCAPQPPVWGCPVTQLSLPGRGFALGSHCPTVGKSSEMTSHHSWQQHLPRPLWDSPGIQLHWEHLWERGEEDQCQVFVPGVSPCLGEGYVGQKYLAEPHRWGGSQPLRCSQSLGQPPKHVLPKGLAPKGPASRAMGQPLPRAQALLHPQVPSLLVPLIPVEVPDPGALPRLAGPPVVCGWCSALPGCPWAESLCDRGDRAQPVLARGSVPRWSHQLPILGTEPSWGSLAQPSATVPCSGHTPSPPLCQLSQGQAPAQPNTEGVPWQRLTPAGGCDGHRAQSQPALPVLGGSAHRWPQLQLSSWLGLPWHWCDRAGQA